MRAPLHHGPLANANGVGAVGNPACGDVVTMHLRIDDGTVVAASFESMGSVYQLATASVMCDCVIGKSMDHARRRTPQCVLEKLPDLPDNKRYLAKLALEALQRALDRFEQGGDPADAHVPMTEAEAEAFVVELLGNGRQWGTLEIDAMARADERAWPTNLTKFLAQQRAAGRIGGAMVGRSWRWWSVESAHGGGRAGHEQP